MTVWLLALAPMVLGPLVWLIGAHIDVERHRMGLCLGVAVILMALVAAAMWAAMVQPRGSLSWAAGLSLTVQVDRRVAVAVVLVAVIAAVVIGWAALHEDASGLPRLLGLELAFVGAMELLVLAGDLLTLAIAWELVGGLSWALIAHRKRDDEAVGSANYAFNATRLGGLGIWLAAGAALASTGSLAFDGLPALAGTSSGHLFALGILLAAAAKSAQGPFGPWLFRAMDGPTSVSALLHSSTMVAAGAWLLVRLHEPLSLVAWFGPAAITLGLVTAFAAGLVASVQTHAKKVLAASTSAQLGLVFVAVGAGAAGPGLAHLVSHAACKALLFMTAGIAITSAGSEDLGDMQLGRRLPVIAIASAIGALSLAALPPIGTSWSKENIIAATGHIAPVLAVVTIAAAALSAWYAIRWQLLAYGLPKRLERGPARLASGERVPVWLLAGASVALAVAWWPSIGSTIQTELPNGWAPMKAWETVLSTASILAAAIVVWLLYRRRLLEVARSPERSWVANWLGLPLVIEWTVARPMMSLAGACAAFDDRWVDGGVRAVGGMAKTASGSVGWIDRHLIDFAIRMTGRATRSVAAAVSRGIERLVDGTLWLLARSTTAVADQSRRIDDDVVDGSIEIAATGVGRSGQLARRAQSGKLPAYYSIAVGGLLLVLTGLLLALAVES